MSRSSRMWPTKNNSLNARDPDRVAKAPINTIVDAFRGGALAIGDSLSIGHEELRQTSERVENCAPELKASDFDEATGGHPSVGR